MARRGDVPTRSEVTETIEKHQSEMQEKTEEMEKTAEDVETERETLESLDLGGTAEGADAVEEAIEGAEDLSTQEFEEQGNELEEVDRESEEHEGELNERSDTTSSDLGKVSDASGRIHGDGANNELVKAKESAVRDIEFLHEQAQRAQEAREETERVHQEQQGRVNSGRRS